MNRLIFLYFFSLSFSIICVKGQSVGDTLHYFREKGDLKFYQNKQEIKFLELTKILKTDPEANEYVKKAKLYRNINGVFLGIGIISLSYGVLFGLSQAIEENDETNVYSGLIAGTVVGGVFIALAIPSGKSYKINAKKAIDIYNRNLVETSGTSIQFKTGISNNGITVILNF